MCVFNFFFKVTPLAWTYLQVFDEYNECMEFNWICMVLRILSVCINLAAINGRESFLWVTMCIEQIVFLRSSINLFKDDQHVSFLNYLWIKVCILFVSQCPWFFSCVTCSPVLFAKLGFSNYIDVYSFFHVFNKSVFLVFCYSNLYFNLLKQ